MLLLKEVRIGMEVRTGCDGFIGVGRSDVFVFPPLSRSVALHTSGDAAVEDPLIEYLRWASSNIITTDTITLFACFLCRFTYLLGVG